MSEEIEVTVYSVHSNVAKIHSRLPAAMDFWLVCLGILAYHAKTPRGIVVCEQQHYNTWKKAEYRVQWNG